MSTLKTVALSEILGLKAHVLDFLVGMQYFINTYVDRRSRLKTAEIKRIKSNSAQQRIENSRPLVLYSTVSQAGVEDRSGKRPKLKGKENRDVKCQVRVTCSGLSKSCGGEFWSVLAKMHIKFERLAHPSSRTNSSASSLWPPWRSAFWISTIIHEHNEREREWGWWEVVVGGMICPEPTFSPCTLWTWQWQRDWLVGWRSPSCKLRSLSQSPSCLRMTKEELN